MNMYPAQALYQTSQVRELDRMAIEDHGIPGLQLMERAGAAAFDLLRECWPHLGSEREGSEREGSESQDDNMLHIFCGTGNNAGDGYVMAALAAQQQIPVRVVQVGGSDKLQGDARLAFGNAVALGVDCIPFDKDLTLTDGIVVDAMLGSGLSGDVREPYTLAIALINASLLPVLSVDLPSGLCGDTGAELGVAVQADATISFIGLKQGLFTGRGPALAGEVFFDDLAVPAEIYNEAVATSKLLDLAELLDYLPPRNRDAHKGDFGHLMVIGGDAGMGGAVALAAEAALRCGAGLVSIATRPEHVGGIVARCPELMVNGVVSGQELEPLLERPTVLVVGPGLGRSPWSEQMLQQALNSGLPLVLDADALNLLVSSRLTLDKHQNVRIITPHPGEAARLLQTDIAVVQRNRFAAVQQLAEQYSAVTVLKGAGSLVADAADLNICPAGNPGMASAGMGDVLSGVIGALLAQQIPAATAAQLGVCLHAEAADLIAEELGERGLLASDLFGTLQELVNAG